MFTQSQQEALAAPLDRANVQTRSQSNRNFSYLEGWHVIAEANRIFGFDGWQRETLHCQCVSERERSIGSGQRSGWGVTYTAKARIQVGEIIREGSGAGHGIDMDLGQAHESALKEAETDAMKRALMTFGNQFGLALYDKQQREVAAKPAPRANRGEPHRVETPAPMAAPVVRTHKAEPVTPPVTRPVVTPVARPVAIPRRANHTGNEGQRATARELLAAELKELITQAKQLPADGLLAVTTLFREKYLITADIPIT
ncbi:RAD52 family DNA repair protein, partial [Synechococcus sp. Cruz CV12-2-Slac-r]|uniref:RAD52 family DNA repair protein n=1 Tax=Synechococcus sp. Cruz CV12-2-Slac-r TaxID=2823748 RepID=UPI0020CE5FA4